MRVATSVVVSAALFALAIPGGAGASDLTIKQRVAGPTEDAKAHDQTEYLTEQKRVTDSEHARSIVDIGAKTVVSMDKDKKVYFVLTFDDIRKRNEQLQKRLESMPPEAKKMMGDLDAPVTLKPTGKTEKIAGYEAKEYAIQGGVLSGSVWVTDQIEPPANAREEWQKWAGEMGGKRAPGGKLAEAMANLKGLPLRTRLTSTMGEAKFVATTEVTSVSTQPPPPEMLKIPDGYKKAEAPATP